MKASSLEAGAGHPQNICPHTAGALCTVPAPTLTPTNLRGLRSPAATSWLTPCTPQCPVCVRKLEGKEEGGDPGGFLKEARLGKKRSVLGGAEGQPARGLLLRPSTHLVTPALPGGLLAGDLQQHYPVLCSTLGPAANPNLPGCREAGGPGLRCLETAELPPGG